MTTIAEVRKQYPQYHDLSDAQLGDALHAKFYADMPRDQFNAKIGLGQSARQTPSGLLTAGNIDLDHRPVVKNADGSISTVRSITITDDKGRAILIPTVVGNRVVSNADAIAYYKKTGQNLGVFNSEGSADSYAQSLHEQQAAKYLPQAQQPDKVAPGGIEGLVRRGIGAKPQAEPPSLMGMLKTGGGALANLYRGTGIADEVVAALNPDVLLGLGRTIVAPQRSKGVLADAYGKSLAAQRRQEDGFSAEHPIIASNLRGVGMTAPMLLPGGQAAALPNTTRLGNMARGAVTAGAQAAAYGLADRGTLDERAKAGRDAATSPVVLGLGAGLGALARPAPRPARAAPAANTPAARLTQAGVPTLMGQRAGGLARRLEDAAESLPMTGAAIKARKTESIQGFNNTAINEALAPIGATVRGHGREAVQAANQHLANAYDDAVAGVRVAPDPQYAQDIGVIVNDPRLPEASRQAVRDIVGEHTGLLGVTPTGRVWKNVDAEIGKAQRAADNASATVPGASSQAAALARLQDAHEALLGRQAPQALDALSRADASYAAMERVRAAAASTGTAAREGLFTAGDLNRAVATKGGRAGRRAYGQGTALMQGLTDDAQAVLPSTVPDSGTALRSLVGKVGTGGGAIAGLGAVAGSGPAITAALLSGGTDAAGALLYSRAVQDALRRGALGRPAATPAGLLSPEELAKLARAGGLLARPQAAPSN